MSDVLFIQTADPFRYREMLSVTSKSVTHYCHKHDCKYESYVGIRRGVHSWHAIFNRIPILADLVAREYRGWVVYLDADAYIFDMNFDLKAYLAENAEAAGVMACIPGATPHWAINSGVFMLNLGSEHGRTIIERWSAKLAELSDERLAGMDVWDDGCSDQSMLYEVLDEDAALRDAVHFESNELINGNYARFIRQILRAYYPSLEARIEALRLAVAEVVPGERDVVADVAPIVVSAFYRSILRRDPDAGGLSHYMERFRERGIETATREMLSGMLESEEYRRLVGL